MSIPLSDEMYWDTQEGAMPETRYFLQKQTLRIASLYVKRFSAKPRRFLAGSLICCKVSCSCPFIVKPFSWLVRIALQLSDKNMYHWGKVLCSIGRSMFLERVSQQTICQFLFRAHRR